MNIAIVGYGDQGRSAYEYWNTPGNSITICDQKDISDKVPQGVQTRSGASYLNDLYKFDLIVRSPGIHPNEITRANTEDPKVLDKVTTVTNEFFRVCPAPIIGVTGTKGKGTTSSLIAHILQMAGHKPILGGNIGIPPLDLLRHDIQVSDVVVLELANFQLIDLRYSPKVAVCLMVAPEHMDWHKDMFEYISAKQQMFTHQKQDNLAVYNARNLYSEEVAAASPAHKEVYEVPPVGEELVDGRGAYVEGNDIKMEGETICHINDVALLGRHNLENVCAAIAATWAIVGGDKKAIKKAIKGFAGLPHRLEIVKQVNGIWYINDSFASNTTATIAAIDAIPKTKVLIIGGQDRQLDLSDLAKKLADSGADSVRKVIIVGAAKQRIATELKKGRYENFVISEATDMNGIFADAQKQAQKGDAILLSPGFPSFDMFNNFEDRGLQFKKIVQGL